MRAKYNKGGRTALYDLMKKYANGGVNNGDPIKGSNPSMSPLANQAAEYETPQYGDPGKIDINFRNLQRTLHSPYQQDPETKAKLKELADRANSLRDSYPGGGYDKDWDDQHRQFYSDLFYTGLQNPDSGIGRLVDSKVVEQGRRGDNSYEHGGVHIKRSRRDTPGFLLGSKETRVDKEGNETGSIVNRSKLARLLGLADVKAKFHEGGTVHEHPPIDPTNPPIDPTRRVANNETTENTVSATYRDNQDLKEAVSPGKIDAYNFSLPDSGLLEDLDEETKSTLLNSDFGKDYLSGEGSIDDQYNAYATKATRYMSENPGQALSAINEMIESGNENFQVLKGKTDQEKLALATSYMTDKKIGDFHGALELTKTDVPRVQFYESTSSNIQGPQKERTLMSIGDRALPEGEVMNFRRAAEEAGINVDSDTLEARRFLREYMDLHGNMNIGGGRESGQDNQDYVTSAAQKAAEALNARDQQQRKKGRSNQASATELAQNAAEALKAREQQQRKKWQNVTKYDGQGRRIN